MPIGGKDAFLSKVTFRRESKWYSKTKQELKDMETIEERANLAAWQIYEETILSEHSVDRVAEIIAEKIHEQKAIDEAKLLKLKSAWEKQAQINHDDEANYQQGYHDAVEKACEWLEGYCCEIGCKYDCNFDAIMVDGPKRFIKALEE